MDVPLISQKISKLCRRFIKNADIIAKMILQINWYGTVY